MESRRVLLRFGRPLSELHPRKGNQVIARYSRYSVLSCYRVIWIGSQFILVRGVLDSDASFFFSPYFFFFPFSFFQWFVLRVLGIREMYEGRRW